MRFFKSSRAADRMKSAVRPVVDVLEDRRLFAVTITPTVDFDGNALLRIVSDNASDNITITETPSDFDFENDPSTDGTTIVEVAGGPEYIGGEFLSFEVILSGGDDTLTWVVDQTYEFDTRSYQVDLGLGTNLFSFSQFSDENLDYESYVSLEVDGDGGNDNVLVKMDDIYSGSVFALDLDLEEGNDYVDLEVESVDSYGEYAANIDLGGGNNTAIVKISGAYYGGSVDVDIAGGISTTGRDVVTVNVVDNIENANLSIDANLNGGNDTMTVNLAKSFDVFNYDDFGEPSTTAAFNLNGGDGNDTITIRRATHAANANDPDYLNVDFGALFDINVNGQNGNDILTVDLDTGDGIELDGRLRVKVDGLAGNDTLRGEFFFSEESGRLEEYEPGFFDIFPGIADIAFRGGHQNDATTIRLIDRSEVSDEGPLIVFQGGYLIVDGGSGTDRRDLASNRLARIRSLASESGTTTTLM